MKIDTNQWYIFKYIRNNFLNIKKMCFQIFKAFEHIPKKPKVIYFLQTR